MSKEINCLFYEGIDKCAEKECYNNILGMCVKKGSANNKVVKPFTVFQKIKMKNLDETARFLALIEISALCQYEGIEIEALGEEIINTRIQEYKQWLTEKIEVVMPIEKAKEIIESRCKQ